MSLLFILYYLCKANSLSLHFKDWLYTWWKPDHIWQENSNWQPPEQPPWGKNSQQRKSNKTVSHMKALFHNYPTSGFPLPAVSRKSMPETFSFFLKFSPLSCFPLGLCQTQVMRLTPFHSKCWINCLCAHLGFLHIFPHLFYKISIN